MDSRSRPLLVGTGLGCGALIVAVDNFAFGGEVSPIVIVLMILVATVFAGAVWGRRAWAAAAVIWACVPLAHAVKLALGLPDTLQPATWRSIGFLALFTMAVATVGTGCGQLLHRAFSDRQRGRPGASL